MSNAHRSLIQRAARCFLSLEEPNIHCCDGSDRDWCIETDSFIWCSEVKEELVSLGRSFCIMWIVIIDESSQSQAFLLLPKLPLNTEMKNSCISKHCSGSGLLLIIQTRQSVILDLLLYIWIRVHQVFLISLLPYEEKSECFWNVTVTV